MKNIIVGLLLLSILLINLPMFKKTKTIVYAAKKKMVIPPVVLEEPIVYPKNFPRVNKYRSMQTQFDYL